MHNPDRPVRVASASVPIDNREFFSPPEPTPRRAPDTGRGSAATLDDPKLELFAGSARTGGNDNGGGSSQLSAALAAVGAFAYTGPTSRDAATTANITTRDNSVKVSAVGSGTGKVIAEIYDATPSASFTTTTPRLINVSVRKHLGAGLTMGFVLGGSTPTKVRIRGIGPTLGAFGVPGTVVDPQLALFNSASAKIGENHDWGGTAELTAPLVRSAPSRSPPPPKTPRSSSRSRPVSIPSKPPA